MRALVTGAGGFIGSHLVRRLKAEGVWVRGVDIKYPEFAKTAADEFLLLDLRERANAHVATRNVQQVYALAAEMGGMGYIARHDAHILHSNALIDFNTIDAAKHSDAERILYTSSACIYPNFRQDTLDVARLREEDAFPAEPQDAYGWEKLTAELLCRAYSREYGIVTHIVRLHNVYGPYGTWQGGREKAPAAICRKIAMAKVHNSHFIEIWGDGLQRRSFCYIDDCIEGLRRVIAADIREPLNLGSDLDISINELVALVASIAGFAVQRIHVAGPQGVRARNSDNSKALALLNWSPATVLREGMEKTYGWIERQVIATHGSKDLESLANI